MKISGFSKYFFFAFILIFNFIFFPFSHAYAHEVSEITRLLQERYENALDVSADFYQETFPAGSEHGIKAEGKVYFKRPQKMRWEYKKPDKQLIVTSGQEVFVYEEEAGQVIIVPRDQFLTSDISKAFFLGKGRLEQHFSIYDVPEAKETVKLIPKEPSAQLKEILISIDPESHLIKEMWLEDHLGGRTHLLFKRIKTNNNLKSSLFAFSPPEGVDIFRTQ